ncbi:EVE domain-containing protein [candidate division KSB3 bacterium]|uniref:EVE domain-containing protein n=1 Tax=candidate division KSB3 bacterium TaxID=2044937 RepID=A0A2G6E6A5_9BACT|nr:MAG: EVE domain-containing protein [candidate division KSB3 bacterium]PIE29840.1 MAG: EVE domain-containing protein [candidate division KSB3 bacterium]
MKYWLMKTDPEEFSLDDLKTCPNQTECWDGVRNYQARNFIRDEMQPGDRVLFYHSRKNPAIVASAKVVTRGYPDHTAWDADNKHFDPKSTQEKPIWYMVDIQLEHEFSNPLPLKFLRTVPELQEMLLLKKGIRLSIQPVREHEFECIIEMGK